MTLEVNQNNISDEIKSLTKKLEEPIKNGEKKEERDEKGRFVEGWEGGPGRPLGRKNFDTLFEEAIAKIVKEKKLPIANPEMEIVVKAVVEALKGNYAYFRDIMDRRYGKPTQPIDMMANLKTENLIKIQEITADILKDEGKT